MHLNEKQSQIMDFLRFDWSNRIREVSKDKTKVMICPSMGPKLFWTNQIILVEIVRIFGLKSLEIFILKFSKLL